MPATRAAALALSALRTRSSHKRFKPQLARVILLRKNLNQLKRTGLVVKHEMHTCNNNPNRNKSV